MASDWKYQENIIMGREFDENRYNQIIACCEIFNDIDSMDMNDESRVGEDGKLLSGGQIARIALALTIYSVADIYSRNTNTKKNYKF